MLCNKFFKILRILGVLSAFLFAIVMGKVLAQSENAPGKAKGGKDVVSESAVAKTIRGAVSYVDNKYVAVVYNRNDQTGEEEEIGFWIDQEVSFNHMKNLGQLGVGDTIDIQYDEVKEDYSEIKPDGSEVPKTRVKAHRVKGLTFISPAKASLRTQ